MKNKFFVLSLSGLFAGLTIIMGSAEPFKLCGDQWRQCMDINYNLFQILIPTIPFFIFALITYFMREEVYKAWIKYALPMLGGSILLTAIMPDSQGGGFGPQISFGKADIALLTSALFMIISIVIIIRAYAQIRK